MSMAKEFKEFAMRGNVVDMAVGIIIGGAKVLRPICAWKGHSVAQAQ